MGGSEDLSNEKTGSPYRSSRDHMMFCEWTSNRLRGRAGRTSHSPLSNELWLLLMPMMIIIAQVSISSLRR